VFSVYGKEILRPLKLPHLDPSEIVVLAGAGISVEEPSGIPAAWGLLEVLLKWAAPDARVRKDLARRMTPGSQFNPYRFLRFEGFIQAVAALDPNIFYCLESTQTFGSPNINHLLFARMALAGSTILTTNFDTRIEQAAGARHLPTFVLSSNRRVPAAVDRLIKLHGSFPLKRGRNVVPRATLTQIGKLGLGFARFPEFQNWFSRTTDGKHLIVMGYSASDSFDVVPLIENFSNARTVTWFSYRPGRRALRADVIRARKSRAPFPYERNFDFTAHTLARLAARRSQPCKVYRVQGTAVQTLLKKMVRSGEDERPVLLDDDLAGPRNLAALQAALSENALNIRQQRMILRLLDDGVFGESYATDVEVKSIRRGKQMIFRESTARFARGTAESRAHTALQRGEPDLAFQILENSARKSADRDQLLLLLHHFEFRLGERDGDRQRLERAVRKTERVSRQSGILWGLIMAEWMKSFRLEAEWRRTLSNQNKKSELTRGILTHTEQAVYYGVRAGWQQWFAAAARLAAKHWIAQGEFDKAENLLKNLLVWLNRETADGIEETAATACALNTLGIQSGRKNLSNSAQQLLSSLDTRICPEVKLLQIAAEAEVAHANRQWKRFTRLKRSADEHILKLDPTDQWGVKTVFEYLRHSVPSGKEAHV
jgi:hypothetical protein